MKKMIFLALLALASCYEAHHDCKDFKTGKFRADIEVGGLKKSTISIRSQNRVIETFEGKTDTSTIRWVNDCEYVLQKINPKNMQEKKAIAIRILTTSKNSYTFEYGIVGSANTQKGTAARIN